jgi:hypothetical protein
LLLRIVLNFLRFCDLLILWWLFLGLCL